MLAPHARAQTERRRSHVRWRIAPGMLVMTAGAVVLLGGRWVGGQAARSCALWTLAAAYRVYRAGKVRQATDEAGTDRAGWSPGNSRPGARPPKGAMRAWCDRILKQADRLGLPPEQVVATLRQRLANRRSSWPGPS